MEMKKNPLSFQLNVDDFVPATDEEKQSLVIMRDSVSFWKPGCAPNRKKPHRRIPSFSAARS